MLCVSSFAVTQINNKLRIYLNIFVLIISTYFNLAGQDYTSFAQTYLKENSKNLNLLPSDLDGMYISDNYVSTHNALNHIYFQQTVKGIPVENAIINLAILQKSGKVVNSNSRFVNDLSSKVTGSKRLNPENALVFALEHLDIEVPRQFKTLDSKQRVSLPDYYTVFEKFGTVSENVPVNLRYILSDDGQKVNLVWLNTVTVTNPEYHIWRVYVDAETGEVLDKKDDVLRCYFGEPHHTDLCYHEHQGNDNLHLLKLPSVDKVETNLAPLTGENYRVFASPTESPNHNARALVTNPFNILASPYGWHDTNGAPGAEYTITRGNNVYAQEDQDNNNNTFGYAPNGGASLLFDYTLDFNQAANTNTLAAQNLNSAITNLFYWNNILHDFSYQYGFTEAAGNFQFNNYGTGGLGNDFVIADALDGGGTNNANFSTPVDGSRPRMQMFLWNSTSSIVTVNAPNNVIGNYSTTSAAFGPQSFNITSDVVIATDSTANPTLACGALTNAATINGKIALIDRGTCDFATKALNAQNAGAIAVLICNNQAGTLSSLGAGTNGGSVTIPTVMISLADCNLLRVQVGLNITMVQSLVIRDGSFDNGIIAHEYGHGISTRLTGGPANSSCLGNQESAGEGWSDFFGLVLTHKSGDTRTTARGVGTYSINQPTFGTGIRVFPYTTDMAINPFTYDSIKTASVPHGVGSVFCTILWDMYWDLIDKYGYSNNIYTGTGGNNIAVQLVMDGLKLQSCSPGFLDSRDAILLADEINYGGANRCLIWAAFARRGLGFSATQASSSSRSDGVQAFDIPNDFLIIKTIAVQEAFEGEAFNVTSKAFCSCAPMPNAQIKHVLPANLTPLTVTGGTIVGNEVRSSFKNMGQNDSITIQYAARISLCDNSPSGVNFFDNVEGGLLFNAVALSGSTVFTQTSSYSLSPTKSWYALNPTTTTNFTLTSINPIAIIGASKLSFYHRYNTEKAWDGGVVEVSINGGTTWLDVTNNFIENGYQSQFASNGSSSLAGRNGFTGDSNEDFNTNSWVKSVIDLSSFDGSSLRFRFRFASDDNTEATGINGWVIDDIRVDQPPGLKIRSFATTNATIKDSVVYPIQIKDLSQPTIYVNASANGQNYGNSWVNSFKSFQEALQIASCNSSVTEVWVANATYLPTSNTDRSISFNLPTGVSLYGGFNGVETLVSQRNLLTSNTILSGNIGNNGISTDNSHHVIRAIGVNNSTVIDGFIIQDGYADDATQIGGGILIDSGSPTIRNCNLMTNFAISNGGGLASVNGSIINLLNTKLTSNTSGSSNARAIYNLNSTASFNNIEVTDPLIGTGGSSISNQGSGTINAVNQVTVKGN